MNEIPLLKEYSKDINLFIKTEPLGWFRKICEVYATPKLELSIDEISNEDINNYLYGSLSRRIEPIQKLFTFKTLAELKNTDNNSKLHSALKCANLRFSKTPLINAFKDTGKKVNMNNLVEFLNDLPDKISYKVYEFLNNITQDSVLSKSLIEDILSKIKQNKKETILERCDVGPELMYEINYTDYFSNILKDKMGNNLYRSWLTDELKGYRKAYNDYFNNEIYDKAENLMDLVKISPNISPWALRAKAKELGIKATLGNLPEVFQNNTNYRKLIEELQLLNIDIHSKENKKYLQNKDKTYDIKINNQLFKITSNNGYSAKLVFKIAADKENYYIKFAPYKVVGEDYKNNKIREKIRENYDLRPDSPYMNAIVDFYLKENNCKNANDIQFYDLVSQSVVYKESAGEKVDFSTQDLYSQRKNRDISEIYDLGIKVNDISADNFIKTKDGRIILIDSGHASFQDDFRPLVMGKQITLGNLCGRE